MRIKVAICRGRSRTIEDAVEAWRGDHDEAMEACDTDDLIDVFLEYFHFLKSWRDEAWTCLFAGKIGKTQKVGPMLQQCLNRAAEISQMVAGCVQVAEENGYTVHRATEAKGAGKHIAWMAADFVKRWPMIDKEEVQASREAIARGEGSTGEEILRELEGYNTAQS